MDATGWVVEIVYRLLLIMMFVKTELVRLSLTASRVYWYPILIDQDCCFSEGQWLSLGTPASFKKKMLKVAFNGVQTNKK